MISNISGFILHSNNFFYISENRPESYSFSKTDLFTEIIKEKLKFNIIISVKRAGIVEFDFTGWKKTKALPGPTDGEKWNIEKEWEVTKLRLLLMNVFLSIFYTQYEKIHRVNLAKTVITSKQQMTRTTLTSPNIGFGSSRTSDLYTFLSQNNNYIGLINWTVPKVISNTIDNFKLILHWKYRNYWNLIDNLAVAHLNHQNNHYSQSLAISWSVIESIIVIYWNDAFIMNTNFDQNKFKISINNHTRNKKYKGSNPNNYSSYTILRVLEDFSIINKTKAKQLHSLRKKRNDWIHELRDIKMKNSHDGLNHSIDLLNNKMPIDLHWAANSSWYTG